MILKDEALALRIYPFGNSSRIVVWLSRTYGKLAVLAKGSQREKSPFLGQFDLFYTCEVLFYAREHRHLHILKECQPLEARTAFRTDWRACAMASYAAGLLDRAVPFGPASPRLYGLLEDTLDLLATRTPGPGAVPRLELRLLQELGLAPDWDACNQCRRDLRNGPGARIDWAHGALLCETCAKGGGVALSAPALHVLRLIRDGAPPPSLPERIFREIRELTGGLLAHHAELSGPARELAFQILGAG